MLRRRWWKRQELRYSHIYRRDVPCFPAGSFDDIDQIVDEVLADIFGIGFVIKAYYAGASKNWGTAPQIIGAHLMELNNVGVAGLKDGDAQAIAFAIRIADLGHLKQDGKIRKDGDGAEETFRQLVLAKLRRRLSELCELNINCCGASVHKDELDGSLIVYVCLYSLVRPAGGPRDLLRDALAKGLVVRGSGGSRVRISRAVQDFVVNWCVARGSSGGFDDCAVALARALPGEPPRTGAACCSLYGRLAPRIEGAPQPREASDVDVAGPVSALLAGLDDAGRAELVTAAERPPPRRRPPSGARIYVRFFDRDGAAVAGGSGPDGMWCGVVCGGEVFGADPGADWVGAPEPFDYRTAEWKYAASPASEPAPEAPVEDAAAAAPPPSPQQAAAPAPSVPRECCRAAACKCRIIEMRRVGDASWRRFSSQKDASKAFGLNQTEVSQIVNDRSKACGRALLYEARRVGSVAAAVSDPPVARRAAAPPSRRSERRRAPTTTASPTAPPPKKKTKTKKTKTKKTKSGFNEGSWSPDEHARFVEAYTKERGSLRGNAGERVLAAVGTRSRAQVRSHAQKYQAKLLAAAAALSSPTSATPSPTAAASTKRPCDDATAAPSAKRSKQLPPPLSLATIPGSTVVCSNWITIRGQRLTHREFGWLFEYLGATVKTDVSRKTSYLILDRDADPEKGKAARAAELGFRVVTDDVVSELLADDTFALAKRAQLAKHRHVVGSLGSLAEAKGKLFVPTGTFPGLSKDQLCAALEACGAKFSDQLADVKRAAFLVQGKAAGAAPSEKLTEARLYGIPVLEASVLVGLGLAAAPAPCAVAAPSPRRRALAENLAPSA